MNRKLVLMLILTLLISTLNIAFYVQRAKASGTIYIRADGSIDPPTAPISTSDNVTYVLTGNITSDGDGIVVERDNIVVDGSGFSIEGSPAFSWHGISLVGRSSVTIQNTDIKNFYYGVVLNSSSSNSINVNTITNNSYGIVVTSFSNNNSISGNSITSSEYDGIWLDYSSSYNSISGNTLTSNSGGIYLHSSSDNNVSENTITDSSYHGIYLGFSSNNSINGNTFIGGALFVWDSFSNFVENNTVNGRPLVYLEGVADYSVEDAGQVVLIRCNRIRVENLNLSRTSNGVQLWETNNNILSGNNMTANSCFGIEFLYSSNNSVSGNIITDNDCGIDLGYSSNNSISGNTITGSCSGIALIYSSGNSLSGNMITNNSNYGIGLQDSRNNSIEGNKIENNGVFGIWLFRAPNNTVCHNNFINNTIQVNDHTPEYANFWDNGCEGNCWSDYNGTDSNSDGIGDTPYVIDANNIDNYPLICRYWSPCDINHDLKVDMNDIGRSARAFGTVSGDTYWNPHADITGPQYLVPDNKVDMRDIGLIASHFGEHV